MLFCTICGDQDQPEELILGDIGILPVAFCQVCRNGVLEFAESQGMVSLAQVYERLSELER